MSNVTEQQYLDLCAKVQRQAHSLAATCGAALRHVPAGGLAAHMINSAGKEALALSEMAATSAQEIRIQQEQSDPGRFDLAALAALPMAGPELGEA